MLTPHDANQDHYDYLSAEAAHREHMTEPVTCDGCGCKTTRDTIGTREIDHEVFCPACSLKLAAAFLPEVLAVARAESRWG